MEVPEPRARRTSKLAVASLLCGLAFLPAIVIGLESSVFWLGVSMALMVVAEILGIAALAVVGRRPAELRGKAFAIVGMVPALLIVGLSLTAKVFGTSIDRMFGDEVERSQCPRRRRSSTFHEERAMNVPEPSARRTSKLAIASLVCGLAFFPAVVIGFESDVFLIGVAPALAVLGGGLGLAALVRIWRRPEALRGKAFAIAGMIPAMLLVGLTLTARISRTRSDRMFDSVEPLSMTPTPPTPAQSQQGQ